MVRRFSQRGGSDIAQNRLPILILLLTLIYLFVIPEEPANFKFAFYFVPLLFIIYYGFRLLPKRKTAVHYFLLAGLIISFIGGLVSSSSILTIIAFTIVNLCYLFGFFSVKARKQTAFPILSISVLLYTGIMTTLLYLALKGTDIESQLLPAILSVLLLALLAWSAGRTGYNYAIWGSILFVLSQTIFLIYTYIDPFAYAEEIVVLTYFSGQLLIATSLGAIARDANSITW